MLDQCVQQWQQQEHLCGTTGRLAEFGVDSVPVHGCEVIPLCLIYF